MDNGTGHYITADFALFQFTRTTDSIEKCIAKMNGKN